MLDVRDCPGKRILVLGNHDRDRDALRKVGFTKQYSLALCATDPPLTLSHIPLRRVPPTAVNVHGHLHEGAEPTGRHINVAIEQIDYSPVGLTWVLDEARRRQSAGGQQAARSGTGNGERRPHSSTGSPNREE